MIKTEKLKLSFETRALIKSIVSFACGKLLHNNSKAVNAAHTHGSCFLVKNQCNIFVFLFCCGVCGFLDRSPLKLNARKIICSL